MMMNRVREILPTVKAAEAAYYDKIERVETTEELVELTARFNEILQQAIDAVIEDKGGDRTSIEHEYKTQKETLPHFGGLPTKKLEELIRHEPDEVIESTFH